MSRSGGINPYTRMQEIAQQLDELRTHDEIEYLFEVIPPELQDGAEQLISLLRVKLAKADA